MTHAYSLRVRLTAIILLPLVAVAMLVGVWQLQNANRTANDVFDRGMLTAALAVANDIAVSGGDALSPETNQLLENSSGGRVFYHAYAPDGGIVAGYATPPVGIPLPTSDQAQSLNFDAIYQGREVSGVRLRTPAQIDGFSGTLTTTVWQDRTARAQFVNDLILRTAIGLGAVLVSLALIVWFGVSFGLRPLTDLEDAIERRSSDDLSSIKRAVPIEVTGIVETLNRLFLQVGGTLDAQSQFIANAAHQLRNPIAGVLSLAEAVASAKSHETMKERSNDLLGAARKTADLTRQLLLHERARSLSLREHFIDVAIEEAVLVWAEEFRSNLPDSIEFLTEVSIEGARVRGDPTILKEAVANLINNAVAHGGKDLRSVKLGVRRDANNAILFVNDDGIGIPEDEIQTAITRFAQIGPSEGSGLGLSIVERIVEGHGGNLEIFDAKPGLTVNLNLPLV